MFNYHRYCQYRNIVSPQIWIPELVLYISYLLIIRWHCSLVLLISATSLSFNRFGFKMYLCVFLQVVFLCSHPLLDFSDSPGPLFLASLLLFALRLSCVSQVLSTGTALRTDGLSSTPPMKRPASSLSMRWQNQR